MIFQCAPNPEDVIAHRRLSDGRTLAVFHDPKTETRVVVERTVYEFNGEQGNVRFEYERASLKTFLLPGDNYFLVITDDTDMPEKWRTLLTRATRQAIMRAYDNFKEGDDDRRKSQAAETHPHSRATDSRG